MSKYEPLGTYLRGLNKNEWRATFGQIERVLGFALPKSARTYPAWWANENGTNKPQKLAWLDAGWETAELNLMASRVIFRRVGRPKTKPTSQRSQRPSPHATVSQKCAAGGRPADKVKTFPNLPAETDCAIRFSWLPIGEIILDGQGKLSMPKAPATPGLYRFVLADERATSLYIGETDNLRRRLQNYRTPGPSQQTNIRLGELMIRCLRGGGGVAVQTASQGFISGRGQTAKADLGSKTVRVLLEHAAILDCAESGAAVLNR